MAVPDFVLEFERAFRKRSRILVAILLGAGAVTIVGTSVAYVKFEGGVPLWFLIYAALYAPALLVAFVFIRKQWDRVRILPRALGQRLSSAGLKAEMILVFDNGLIFIWGRSGAQFCLIGSASGTKSMIASGDVARFLRGLLRMRTALRVGPKHGPESLRARLDSIRTAMGSRFAFLFVYLSRAAALPDARRPSWIARISLGGGTTNLLDPNRILQQVDNLSSLLEDAVGMAQTQPSTGSRAP